MINRESFLDCIIGKQKESYQSLAISFEESVEWTMSSCRFIRNEIESLKEGDDFLDNFSNVEIMEINQINMQMRDALIVLNGLQQVFSDEKITRDIIVERGNELKCIQEKILKSFDKLDKKLAKDFEPNPKAIIFLGWLSHCFYFFSNLFRRIIFFLKIKQRNKLKEK